MYLQVLVYPVILNILLVFSVKQKNQIRIWQTHNLRHSNSIDGVAHLALWGPYT